MGILGHKQAAVAGVLLLCLVGLSLAALEKEILVKFTSVGLSDCSGYV